MLKEKFNIFLMNQILILPIQNRLKLKMNNKDYKENNNQKNMKN